MYACLSFDDISPAFVSVKKMESIIDFLGAKNVPATFFVIPNAHGSGLLTEKMARSIRSALERGHEIGLHGYMHVPNEFGYLIPTPFPTYEKQESLIRFGRRLLRQCIDVDPIGFRAPGYRHNKTTMKVLRNLGFKYDSSKTVFKPAYLRYFRVKTTQAPKPTLVEGLVEIPVTGDYTYNLRTLGFRKTMQRALADFEWIYDLDGVFVVNAHSEHLDILGLEFLDRLVKRIGQNSEIVRLEDVALRGN